MRIKPISEPLTLNELRIIESGFVISNMETIQRMAYQLRKMMGDPHPEAQ